MMKQPHRKSIRLKGYDYSQPGFYFVTICAQHRRSIFGDVVEGVMQLSDAGKIVERCWNDIPHHFPHVRLGAFQIIMNHVHGIVEIKSIVGTRHAVSLHEAFGKPQPGSLSTIIRSFKSVVTKQVRETGLSQGRSFWQSRYYDHIIRSDREHFFIARYIELNPLMWHLDSNNPAIHEIPMEEFERTLRERHGLDDHAVRYITEYESGYRAWRVT